MTASFLACLVPLSALTKLHQHSNDNLFFDTLIVLISTVRSRITVCSNHHAGRWCWFWSRYDFVFNSIQFKFYLFRLALTQWSCLDENYASTNQSINQSFIWKVNVWKLELDEENRRRNWSKRVQEIQSILLPTLKALQWYEKEGN